MSWFVLDVNPEPWAVGPLGVGRKNGRTYPYVGQNAQLAAYQSAVREALGPQVQIEGDLDISFFFWRNLVTYKTQAGRDHRKHHADVTNMQKATEDALQGVLFDNDKYVVDVHSVVMEQGPEVRGKIAIRVDPVIENHHDYWWRILPSDVRNQLREIDERPVLAASDLEWGDASALF